MIRQQTGLQRFDAFCAAALLPDVRIIISVSYPSAAFSASVSMDSTACLILACRSDPGLLLCPRASFCLRASLYLRAHQKERSHSMQVIHSGRTFTVMPVIPYAGSNAHVSDQNLPLIPLQ